MKPATLFLLAGLLGAALAAGFPANQAKDDRAEVALQAALKKEAVDGDLKGAIELYKKVAASTNRAAAAKALLRMGHCHEKLGNAEARTAYQRVVREFADQAEIVAQARVRLAALGGPGAAGGLVARRVLTDASGVGDMWTADGKYISHIEYGTGDLVQFEVASGQRSRIINRGPTHGTGDAYCENPVYSRDGKQIAYTWYTKDVVSHLQIRNLDGSGLRTLYKGSYALAACGKSRRTDCRWPG